jgi:cell division septal protein FtsQ
MGFEVCVIENPPNGRATHGVRRSLMDERGRDVVEAPPRGSAVVISRFTGRDGYDGYLG